MAEYLAAKDKAALAEAELASCLYRHDHRFFRLARYRAGTLGISILRASVSLLLALQPLPH